MAVIDSLKLNNGTILYPKTLTSAIYNDGGTERLDNILAKSIYADDEIPATPLPRDADTLGGLFPSGYALKDAGIVESGSNANGRYIKYGDGTMVCYKEISMDSWINQAAGNIFMSQDKMWTFPVAYLYIPDISHSMKYNIPNAWAGLGSGGTSLSATTVRVFSYTTNGSANYIPSVSMIAIGRWK